MVAGAELTGRQLALSEAEIIENCSGYDLGDGDLLGTPRIDRVDEPKTKKRRVAKHEQLVGFVLADPTQKSRQCSHHRRRTAFETFRLDEHTSFRTQSPRPAPVLPYAMSSTPELKSATDEQIKNTAKRNYTRGMRQRWTVEETNDLKAGVALCGVGRWKDILEHARFHFQEARTHVDLKDKFRTLFPPHQPEKWAKHTQKGVRSTPKEICKSGREKPPNRVPYKIWTDEEDARLDRGFEMYGFQWKTIAQDQSLRLGHRRANQLRDRFRRRHPNKYEERGGVSKVLLPKKQQGRPRKDKTDRDAIHTNTSEQVLDQGHDAASGNLSEAPVLSSSAGHIALPLLQWNDMAVQPMFDL